MATSRFFREDFDRDRDFVALRKFKFNGKSYIPNQSVDKVQFTVRRLRQLYDLRNIGYPLGVGVKTILPPGMTDPTPVADSLVQTIYSAEGVNPPPTSPERLQQPPTSTEGAVSGVKAPRVTRRRMST